MKKIGCKGNIFILLLNMIVFLFVLLIIIVFNFLPAILFCIVSLPYIYIQFKLKDVSLNSNEITITGLLNKQEIYPIDSFDEVGYFIYPYCYISFANGQQFFFQIPNRYLLFNSFTFGGDKKDYLDEITEQINQIKKV